MLLRNSTFIHDFIFSKQSGQKSRYFWLVKGYLFFCDIWHHSNMLLYLDRMPIPFSVDWYIPMNHTNILVFNTCNNFCNSLHNPVLYFITFSLSFDLSYKKEKLGKVAKTCLCQGSLLSKVCITYKPKMLDKKKQRPKRQKEH